tara:strand:+ start:591 stop:965 length:375 start_codon:yes stop_codon:yes gene_type:complete
MNFKIFKILTIITSFFFLTGFTPILSVIGPGMTILTSGNIYKASAQFIIDQSIKKQTGKSSLTLVKEELDKKSKKNKFNENLKKLVEERVKITRKKLDDQNLKKLLKKRMKITRAKLNINNITQ